MIQDTINNKDGVSKITAPRLAKVQFRGGFWQSIVDIIREQVIPYQWKALNDEVPDASPSHAIENFRIAAGLSKAERKGRVFQDSDVAKWLEAVSYSLAAKPNASLEQIADHVIDLIAQAQQPDGYLNTHFSVVEPENRWTNVRDRHEMYCAGHLIEAGVAYYEATGKRKLLEVVCKLADHIDTVFGPEEGKKRGYPGHQEIELALVRLYRVTGESRYLKLSQYFIDERGKKPHYFELEAEKRNSDPKYYNGLYDYSYGQAHIPVREQEVAIGHSVRAMYMYTAMADLAKETGDSDLAAVCKRLWHNVTRKQMYITGGVGSLDDGEAFTFDYDLPNNATYAETCASIGLVFWAYRMLELEQDADYADVMERALYNGVLSGISLDGEKYFYVNPLEVWPEATTRPDIRHVEYVRQQWFGCACCPPNVARLLASLAQYAYSVSEDSLYVHLYTDSIIQHTHGANEVKLSMKTNYPWDKDVAISLETNDDSKFTLALRIPGWCREAKLTINDEVIDLDSTVNQGYALINRTWSNGDKVKLSLAMPIAVIKANPKVRANAGKVALQRGPIVYCLEEVDNGAILSDISLPKEADLTAQHDSNLLGGVTVIRGTAYRTEDEWTDDDLYKPASYDKKPVEIQAVPYFTWSNRKPGEMLVWLQAD